MAKKRRTAGIASRDNDGPNMDVGSSKKRIRDYQDVAGSDDDFHLQRDEVLLGEEPEAKRRRKLQEDEEFLEPSDEEVLDYSDENEEEEAVVSGAAIQTQRNDEDSASEDADGGDAEDDELGWGMSKADLYGADVIETEEQALEEEAEALRLQKKQLQSMSAADYGFDEAEWQDTSKVDIPDQADVVTEALPQLQVPEDLAIAERLKLLKARYPEFEYLSKEMLELRDVHAGLREELAKAKAHHSANLTSLSTVTKLRAASAYLGALVMYFAILTSTARRSTHGDDLAVSPTYLRDHPVMDSLVQSRELWQRVQSMPDDQVLAQDGEATELRVNEDSMREHVATAQPPAAPMKKSRAQRHAEAAQAATEACKADRLAKTEASLADLDGLLVASTSRKRPGRPTRNHAGNEDFDIGEEAPLTAREAADKASRKKSLRFYTSQIAQKANKRGTGGRNAGGDEDVPHRERLRDRQARLNAEAEKRGRGKVDPAAELGGESDENDEQQAKQIRDEAAADEYYDLVAAQAAKKKVDKIAYAEAQKEASLHGGRVIEEETVGADGKRKISYAIEKNKGLTPHRKKDVRNPRVKKRKKFEEKKKKLASMKPTYKGGEGRGGYGGELTGIKKGLVRSTKF
jgi:U3 small nucleolar RNA-associated protein 3